MPAFFRSHPLEILGYALSALAIAAAAPAFAVPNDYPIRFETEKRDGQFVVVARNEGPSTISAHATLTAENTASNKIWPIDVVVAPYSSQDIAVVWALIPHRASKFSYTTSYQFGDMTAVHDPHAVYRLPFEEGRAFRIDQAFGGVLTTHANSDTQYAVDINMPEGTPVVAARSGIVVDATFTNSIGADDPALIDKANTVIIMHDDGTLAEYAHLAQTPVLVARGQRVEAGATIAHSGNTGYSSGAHLHFAVSRPALSDAGQMRLAALPFDFYTHNPPILFRPQAMKTVSAIYDLRANAVEKKDLAAPAATPKGAVTARAHATVAGSIQTTLAERCELVFADLRQYLLLTTDRVFPAWALAALLALWLIVRARARERVTESRR